MEELIIALHIHSVYSDGSGTFSQIGKSALKAGLDAFITTDHNVWLSESERYYKEGRKKVLMLTGEEVHDPSLIEGKNHLLIVGADRDLAPFSKDPQNLINQVNRSEGLSFIAHPIEDPLHLIGEKSYSWLDWDIKDYTGIELWNQMSEFKSRSNNLFKIILYAFFPKFLALGPLEKTLTLWDMLLSKGKPIVIIGGNDAHALKIKKGPLKTTIYPYDFQFKSFRTHILTPAKLSGTLETDKKMILDALRLGHSFIAYDLPSSTKGFRFTVNNKQGEFVMGDQVSAVGGLTFQVKLPFRAHCRLLKDGKLIKETFDREVLTYLTIEPGIYRVEVFIDFLGKKRGWIFSNPIYVN